MPIWAAKQRFKSTMLWFFRSLAQCGLGRLPRQPSRSQMTRKYVSGVVPEEQKDLFPRTYFLRWTVYPVVFCRGTGGNSYGGDNTRTMVLVLSQHKNLGSCFVITQELQFLYKNPGSCYESYPIPVVHCDGSRLLPPSGA